MIGRRPRLTLNTTEFRMAMRMVAAPDALVEFQRERIMDALEHDFPLLTACGFGTEA